MKFLLSILISCGAMTALGTARAGESASPRLKAYYTRLPFEDHGFTGKYADIIVELPQRARVIFSREFGDQPRWLPRGGLPHSVARLIARQGDGPEERPDNHNIACHAAVAWIAIQEYPFNLAANTARNGTGSGAWATTRSSW